MFKGPHFPIAWLSMLVVLYVLCSVHADDLGPVQGQGHVVMTVSPFLGLFYFTFVFVSCGSYEPELHPGVTYRLKSPKACLKIFSTGSITVTGNITFVFVSCHCGICSSSVVLVL